MTGNFVVAVHSPYLLFLAGILFKIINAVKMKCGFKIILVEKRYKTNIVFMTVVKAERSFS